MKGLMEVSKARFSYVDILLLVVVIIWGTDFPLCKIALREFYPTTFAALRTMLAAPTLLLALRIREGSFHVSPKGLIALAMLGFFGQFLNRISFSYGLTYTTGSSASIIMASSPIFAALLALGLNVEQITVRSCLGIIFAFAGVSVVMKGDWPGTPLSGTLLLGDLLILGAALSWAMFSVHAKRVVTVYGILRTTAWSSTFGALFMLPVLTVSVQHDPVLQHSLSAWMCVVYISIMGNAIAHIFWISGVSRIGPTRTTIYLTLVPIVAIILSQIILGEAFLATHLLGVALTIGGVYLTRTS